MKEEKFNDRLGWALSILLMAIAIGFIAFVFGRMKGVEFKAF